MQSITHGHFEEEQENRIGNALSKLSMKISLSHAVDQHSNPVDLYISMPRCVRNESIMLHCPQTVLSFYKMILNNI